MRTAANVTKAAMRSMLECSASDNMLKLFVHMAMMIFVTTSPIAAMTEAKATRSFGVKDCTRYALTPESLVGT